MDFILMNGTQYWFNSDLIEVHRKPSQRTSHFFKVVSDGQWDMVGKFDFGKTFALDVSLCE